MWSTCKPEMKKCELPRLPQVNFFVTWHYNTWSSLMLQDIRTKITRISSSSSGIAYHARHTWVERRRPSTLQTKQEDHVCTCYAVSSALALQGNCPAEAIHMKNSQIQCIIGARTKSLLPRQEGKCTWRNVTTMRGGTACQVISSLADFGLSL